LGVGAELEPSKWIFVLGSNKLGTITNRRQIGVAMSAEVLTARDLVLVPFRQP
jgi:hypothetical protein